MLISTPLPKALNSKRKKEHESIDVDNLLTAIMTSHASECVKEGETVYKVKFSVAQTENCVVVNCKVPPGNIIKSLAHCETIHKDFMICGWDNRKKTTEANIKLDEKGYYIVSKKQCEI